MNDTKITTTSQVSLVVEFVDEDTRTINQDNPKQNITPEDIAAIAAAAAGVLIGDKTGARFRRVKTADRRNTTTTTITLE